MKKFIMFNTAAMILLFLLASCSGSSLRSNRFSGNWQGGLFIVDERSNDSIVWLVKEILQRRGLPPGRLLLHELRYRNPLNRIEVMRACRAAGMVFAWNRPSQWKFACKRKLI